MNPKKILIIDDEPHIVENLCEIFQSDFWITETANTGLEAVKLISEFNPSVIISDINMPEMSGLELLSHLDEAKSTIPVILLTGYRDIHGMQKAWECSVFDFLDKPFELDHLLRVVNCALEYGPDYVVAARNRSARIKNKKVA